MLGISAALLDWHCKSPGRLCINVLSLFTFSGNIFILPTCYTILLCKLCNYKSKHLLFNVIFHASIIKIFGKWLLVIIDHHLWSISNPCVLCTLKRPETLQPDLFWNIFLLSRIVRIAYFIELKMMTLLLHKKGTAASNSRLHSFLPQCRFLPRPLL